MTPPRTPSLHSGTAPLDRAQSPDLEATQRMQPTSPKTRPREKPLVRSRRTPPRRGHVDGTTGNGDIHDGGPQYVPAGKGKKTCDEYVLDEDRLEEREGRESCFARVRAVLFGGR